MIAVAAAAVLACTSPPQAAVADSMAALFDRHRFVFISSTHGDTKIHDFLLCLLSRPGLERRITDVLVEWASPVHQQVMDRYLLALEPLPVDSLRPVWFETDYPPLWATIPQMPAFFAAVRALNARVDPSRRIRVVGGNEPVDWKTVRGPADMARFPFKNNTAIHLILEHLAPASERRVLVVYGIGHVHHNGGPLMSGLEDRIDRDQLFVVGTIHTLRMGERDRVRRFGDPDRPFFLRAAGFPTEVPLPEDFFYAAKAPLASHIDAVVYLGPEPDRNLTNTIAFTAAEKVELARRESILQDSRRVLQIRLGGRAEWFRKHPADFPDPP